MYIFNGLDVNALKLVVMRSIKDNITEEVVLNEINDIVRLPMYADRISNDKKAFEKNGRRK
ncbi:hypothetical protein HanOQP8_Chr10g0353331 [Helianthus annuus]|nr:hypothetical protein HanOQP8_Chr10g0353331 [Helianthus annuus]